MVKRSKAQPKKKAAANKQSRSAKRLATDGFIKVHFKQAKLALSELWLRPLGNLMTLSVIAMALTLPTCLYLLGKNIAIASSDVTSPAHISGFVQEDTTEARIIIIKDSLESLPVVLSVDYISSQQGLADLSEYSGFENAISLLDNASLPAVLIVTPSDDKAESTEIIVEKMRSFDVITDVRLDEDWLSRLDAIKSLVAAIVIALSILMLGSVFLIVGSTLRFNVLANKEEIQTMKLIGATDGFILRPYLYTGMWFGLLGSITAWSMTAVVTVVLNDRVELLAALYDSQFRLIGLNWDESLLLVVVGTFLGCVAAKISAHRHLKEIEPV